MAAVDWFGAAEIAAPAPSRPPRAPKAAPAVAPRRRVRAGRPVGGWIVWISVFAVLLAGVVAVNVAVLRANIDMNKLNQQTTQLQEQNAALASQVSAASSSLRIEAAARRLGLVPASATDTSYVNLGTAK
jgi:cell division protein FtsL